MGAAGILWNLKLLQSGGAPNRDELIFTKLSDIAEWIKHSFGEDATY